MKKSIVALPLLLWGALAQAQTSPNSTFCGETVLNFDLSSGNYHWYNAPSGGTLLGTGPSLNVQKSQAFVKETNPDSVLALYAEGRLQAGFSSTQASAGVYGNSFDATQGANELKILFTTYQAVSIDSLTISVSFGSLSCSSNPTPRINLAIYKPSDPSFISTKQITFTCTGSGEGFYKIPVGIELSTPGEYGIRVGIGTLNSYKIDYFTPSTSFYPTTLEGVISFASDDDGLENTAVIPSLFDWVISLPTSNRVEVTKTKDCALGIEKLPLGGQGLADIYPNPFGETISFQWKSPQAANLTVSDLNGLVMEKQQLKGMDHIALGQGLAKGSYIVRVVTARTAYTTKIIKR